MNKKPTVEIPLEQLLNYKGNRYKIARACMEYVKCIRYLNKEEANSDQAKEVLVALKHILDNDIKHTSDKFEIELHQDEIEFLKNFKNTTSDGKATASESPNDDDSVSMDKTALTLPEQDEPYHVKPLPDEKEPDLALLDEENDDKLPDAIDAVEDNEEDTLKLKPPAMEPDPKSST
ncbi:hypothetical protein COTS27_00493 [Spirochaetota bacterium]|nr:hypothetical protein COTS27_00493 [Spirochaetota bacterium]